MAMNALTIIKQVAKAGARFVIDGEKVGLDRLVSAELMALARDHKDAIRAELEAPSARLKAAGLKRLKAATAGLPLDFAELQAFFSDDLESFGAGEVQQAGIRKACEWFAYSYPAWRDR